MFSLAILAVVGCAMCNGLAAVLQKIGADSQRQAHSLDASLLLRMIRNAPYVGGLALDLLGWGLTVFAVRFIPLYLAEAVIASSVAVTALLEWLLLKRRLARGSWAALALLFLGLGLLGSGAPVQTFETVHGATEMAILLAPVICLALGAGLARLNGRAATVFLALLSGVAFGGTSVVGRVLPLGIPWWHVLTQPLFYALGVYGFAGVWLFTIALQRERATTINALMTAAQTIGPTFVGLFLLSDTIKDNHWPFLVLGLAAALLGVGSLARISAANAGAAIHLTPKRPPQTATPHREK